jgi:NADH-quinone oxidoreductase subunit F
MVDMARYFLSFLRDESCGQCTFCRIGTTRMYEILDKICLGKGRPADLDELRVLAGLTTQGSICGLGRTAPNPVLTTLRYFLGEYEAHIAGRCPAGKCKPLVQYVVGDNCTGCTLCAQHCPVNAIPMTPYRRHRIDADICTRCDVCRVDCPENAITIMSGGAKCPGHSHHDPLPELLTKHE